MKNTLGESLSVTVFGESHGEGVGCVIDGIAPGIAVDEDVIAKYLSRRRPHGKTETARREPDEFKIISGVFNSRTTGSPVCIMIPNVDVRSSDYEYGVARPSHADYAAHVKYHGYEDYRGGGHFSGRITAALVAAGGIVIPALENIGVRVGTHILRCADVCDRPFGDVAADISLLNGKSFPVLDEGAEEKITAAIAAAAAFHDSVGGAVQTAICGIPAGVGEPWFDSVESMLSRALFGVSAVKGIEFGAGFDGCRLRGSAYNDALRIIDGKVVTATNSNGGINGGITNGMPVLFNCAVKPTPSISKPQLTVDFVAGRETELIIHGRHDPAIIRRICPVIDSVTAIVTADLLTMRYGTDVLLNGVGK